MGLLVCISCGRQRIVKPIKKSARYFCNSCGAKQIRIIRSQRHAGLISWTDKEGVSEYEAKHQTYAGLRRHAESRGYKNPNGWCAHKFRQIFGRWPNGEASEQSAPAAPSLLWWVRKQNAAYRKQKRAEEQLRLADVGNRLPVRDGSDVNRFASPLMSNDDWSVKW